MKSLSIQYHQFGPPVDVVEVVRRDVPRLGFEDVLVQMQCMPINPSDLIPIWGAYAHRISLPSIAGYEGVGVVRDVGQGVSRSLIGKRVLPLRGEGTWQEFVKASAHKVVEVPEDVTDETACQAYINPVTAWLVCTEALKLGKGDVVVVNAGGSAIGRIFAQLSKILGFRLISVVRNPRHTEDLIKLGAWHVIDTTTTSLRESVLDLTDGRGASAGIDSIGGAPGELLMRSIGAGGRMVNIGLLSGSPVDSVTLSKITGVTVRPYWLKHWVEQASDATWQATLRMIFSLIRAGDLRFMPAARHFHLTDVRDAISATEHLNRFGKVILIP